MIKDPLTALRRYAVYLFTFIAYLSVLIFVGLFLKIGIGHWTLVIAFLSYNLFVLSYLRYRYRKFCFKQIALLVAVSVVAFLALTSIFAKTYDQSYDGMFYHGPAVIALSKGWNPVYQGSPMKQVDLPQKFALQTIEGSPKDTWAVEASIYRLSGSLNSVTCLNLIMAFIAFIFIYTALRELGFSNRTALIFALLIMVIENTVDEFFSFREDGISYDLLVIGVSSLIMLIKSSKNKGRLLYFWCLAASLILVAGTKLSNLFVLGPLLALVIYLAIKRHWFSQRAFRLSLLIGLLMSFLVLFNPYITNVFRYGAIDYPYNQAAVANYARTTGVPENIRNDNRFQLLFYGAFSRVNDGATNYSFGNAKLKPPFTFTLPEAIAESDAEAKGIGGYGLLFSGLLILALIVYVCLITQHKKDKRGVIRALSICLGLIVIACLLNPIANYGRYAPELELVPVIVAASWFLLQKQKIRFPGSKYLLNIFIVLIALNALFCLMLVPISDSVEFKNMNYQLSGLRASNSTYLTYAGVFYANYNLMQEHGVKIKISARALNCRGLQTLDYSRYSTELCKL